MNVYKDDAMKIKEENEGLALYSFKFWLIALYKRDLKNNHTDEYIEKFVDEYVMAKEGESFKNEQIQLYWDIYLSGYITSIVNNNHGLLEQFNSNIKNNV